MKQTMDENTLKKLLYSLDVGLIEQLPDGLFEVVGYPPEWFRHLFPEGVLENKKFAFNDRTSFLGNFIFDAEKFWDSKQPEQVLWSGLWEEVIGSEGEALLEAGAGYLDGRKLLIVKQFSNKGENYKDVIQTAREELLASEKLTVQKTLLEHKKAKLEQEVKLSEQKYSILVEQSNDGIVVIQDGLIKFANSKMSEVTGYSLFEVFNQPFVDHIAPEHRAFVMKSYTMRQLGEKALPRYEVSILTRNSREVPVEMNVSRIDYDGKPADMAIVRDITERKAAEEERQQSTKKLLQALREAIEAVAMTVEIRDPYTSGHQKRVTDLAASIAREMELTDDEIEAVQMSAVVHDIGKLYVPAELLAKPGILNEVELSMIKLHAQAGYDILKTVEFPWPIAQIVLQHHERLNGSGYPKGLKENEILLEAKILAVADVVESIASFRPYRPALGLDAALEEISRYRGQHYDMAAVDACLRLFREKGYTLIE